MAEEHLDHASRKRYHNLMLFQAFAFIIVLLFLAFYRQMLSVGYAPGILLTALCLTSSYGFLLYSLGTWRTPADAATIFRFFLGIIGLIIAVLGEGGRLWILGIMVLASLGDWIDGWLATLYGATPQGAILDAETDQMLIFMLAVLGMTLGGLGSWLLLFPFYRYGYILLLALFAIPADNPKPKEGNNFRGRVVCAVTQTALLVNLMPSLSLSVKVPLSATVLVLLTFSFVDDIFYQLR